MDGAGADAAAAVAPPPTPPVVVVDARALGAAGLAGLAAPNVRAPAEDGAAGVEVEAGVVDELVGGLAPNSEGAAAAGVAAEAGADVAGAPKEKDGADAAGAATRNPLDCSVAVVNRRSVSVYDSLAELVDAAGAAGLAPKRDSPGAAIVRRSKEF